MSYRFVDSFRAEPGWSSILILLGKKKNLSPFSIKVFNIFQGNPSPGRLD